ncbi:hypothetical protein [Maribacter flavus]|uniref:Uncharacterized protein n=1 Tax=Maribacter flavus TaxID=1658664 RepID=A0A5B2TVE5_9FLAO|nr:hypothetical protein [Maribacter flavus]KAA2218284.1 hypothetical protein F0361_01290 [Maribacter flavus]
MKAFEEYQCIDCINEDGEKLSIKIYKDAIVFVSDEESKWELDQEQSLMVSDSLKANLENS